MCWEDPEILMSLTRPNDRILTVGSAGCIALSSLIMNPSYVRLIDTNTDQLNLVRLKEASYRYTNYDDCMVLLGAVETKESLPDRAHLLNTLQDKIALDLKQWLHRFKPGFSKGIIRSGRFERYLASFSQRILPIAVRSKWIQQFLACRTLSEQASIYHEHINNTIYKIIFKGFFGRFYMALKGRHPDLLKYLDEDPASVYYERIKHSWLEVPIERNYFFRFIIENKFNPSLPLPPWAIKEHFDIIKTGLDKLNYVHASITTFLAQDNGPAYDIIYLSDITETMTTIEAERLFALCNQKLNPQGKLVIWNNMVNRRPTNGFRLNEQLSRECWTNRMISLYGFLGVYERS